jgi:glutaredoxin-related protein
LNNKTIELCQYNGTRRIEILKKSQKLQYTTVGKNENNRKELKPTTTKETIPKRILQYKQLGKNDKIITTEAHNAL